MLKAGAKVKFGDQPFQVLSILLERPGELVTREELQKRLWPDTFVDVDHNLNAAINKIREVLGDSAERPRFVETLPRRGYRFIGELETPIQPPRPVGPIKLDRGSMPRRFKVVAGAFAILVVVVAALLAHRWRGQRLPNEQAAASTSLPFTALPGRSISPAFSPDGSRIALAWNGDPKGPAKGFDLYVKALGSETLLRLTQHPSEWISPAWSPDGTQIAFHRMDGADSGIYVVPALGGQERKLRATQIGANFSAAISWSPDGKWIAFADQLPSEAHARINLLSLDTLEARQIPNNSICITEGQPAFSHDGEYLAYWCLRNVYDSVLYSLRLRSGMPKTISSVRAFANGLAWSANDAKLIYSLNPLESGLSDELGEVAVGNGLMKKLEFARNGLQPTVSPKNDKLAYSSLFTDSNLWRRDLLHPDLPAVELIPSSRAQFDAQYSPEESALPLRRYELACKAFGSAALMVLILCRFQIPLM